MADYLLDSDVIIWTLRGNTAVVDYVSYLASQGRIGLSVITRGEVIQGMRANEREGTLALLDSFESIPVDRPTADRAGEIVRSFRKRGLSLALDDSLIGATAPEARIPLYTCNPRHFPMDDLDLRPVRVSSKA